MLLPAQGYLFCLHPSLKSQPFPGPSASHQSASSSIIISSLKSLLTTQCTWAPPLSLYHVILYPCPQDSHHRPDLHCWLMHSLLSLCPQNISLMKGRDLILFINASIGTHSRCSSITRWVRKWVSQGQGSPRWFLGDANKWYRYSIHKGRMYQEVQGSQRRLPRREGMWAELWHASLYLVQTVPRKQRAPSHACLFTDTVPSLFPLFLWEVFSVLHLDNFWPSSRVQWECPCSAIHLFLDPLPSKLGLPTVLSPSVLSSLFSYSLGILSLMPASPH